MYRVKACISVAYSLERMRSFRLYLSLSRRSLARSPISIRAAVVLVDIRVYVCIKMYHKRAHVDKFMHVYGIGGCRVDAVANETIFALIILIVRSFC